MRQSASWLLWFFISFSACPSFGATVEAQPASESPFPLPQGLEKAVEFWKLIFSEYSSSQLVFFDPLDMSRIYEVQNVGEGSRPSQYINGEVSRIAAVHGVDPERVKAQRGIKERTAEGIKRSGRYIAQMQQIFRERGLPVEIAFLPIVESSYDINARSNVGALGMWQFMRTTGKQYMRVDRHIDERKDPLESTRAAASFLKQAYESLDSWPLAITSYNFGPAGMARAVSEVGSNNLVTLIEKYNHRYWGFAPKNFYAEFLAAVEIGKNFKQYFPGLTLDSPQAFEEVEVKKSTSVAALANTSGLTHQRLLEWNPALSGAAAMVPAGYRIKLPADDKPAVVVADATPSRPQAQAQHDEVVRHRVKRGETLIHIAQRYGASVERILQANGLQRRSLLKVGSTLLVPKI